MARSSRSLVLAKLSLIINPNCCRPSKLKGGYKPRNISRKYYFTMSTRGASFTIGSLRRPSNPQGERVESTNQLQTSPRVDLTRSKEWSGHCFEKQMILRSDIPPPPDSNPVQAPALPHDLKGPPGVTRTRHHSAAAALYVPSEGHTPRTAVDYVPPPLKVKHFAQVSSVLKPLVENELLDDQTMFPLDWLPPPDDTAPLSPRFRTGSSVV